MKLPRLFRPAVAGALLLASQALENLGRRIAPKVLVSPPPRPSKPAGGDYQVALSPEATSMLAKKAPRPEPVEDVPLAGSIAARRLEGSL